MILILFLAMWPFHKKPAVIDSPKPCETQGNLWFYTEEGVIGISEVSCAGAHYNWKIMHVDPVRMSRA